MDWVSANARPELRLFPELLSDVSATLLSLPLVAAAHVVGSPLATRLFGCRFFRDSSSLLDYRCLHAHTEFSRHLPGIGVPGAAGESRF